MTKRMIISALSVVVAVSTIAASTGCDGFFTTKSQKGVRIGATVDEVEKALGPAITVLPNFGREQRFYKAASGTRYMLTFEDGKVVEIH